MKGKVEFPTFCIVWLTACLEILFSFQQQMAPWVVGIGLVMATAVILFSWANSGTDLVINYLTRPAAILLLIAIISSAIFTGSPLMLCAVGIQTLILWRIEGSDTSEYSYLP